MSTLRVHPPGLDGYAALLSRAQEDSQTCQRYAGQWIPEISPVEGGIINPLVYEHIAVQQRLAAMLTKVSALLDGSRGGVSAASTAYQEETQQAAADLDAAYPEVQRPIAGVV
ncbi:hypothetical protein [Actinoplanes couchii]|uniref:PE domain-containing protein n=1 Tax=Actinoplanes couchii TaxID=403638 RepID=A0ABQ3X1Q4_9ACTN|nr:hypothetical protein [Actinoplanes couchii]MDR6316843.1 hypothetical protein [Actinoplanes couchii]GID52450.1 hypothetical protein Aco03nite_008540 [Actinoplanes couchii]